MNEKKNEFQLTYYTYVLYRERIATAPCISPSSWYSKKKKRRYTYTLVLFLWNSIKRDTVNRIGFKNLRCKKKKKASERERNAPFEREKEQRRELENWARQPWLKTNANSFTKRVTNIVLALVCRYVTILTAARVRNNDTAKGRGRGGWNNMLARKMSASIVHAHLFVCKYVYVFCKTRETEGREARM